VNQGCAISTKRGVGMSPSALNRRVTVVWQRCAGRAYSAHVPSAPGQDWSGALRGTGVWSIGARPSWHGACQNLMRVWSEPDSEPRVLVMGPEPLRVSAPPGLNHKLRACCTT